MNPGEFIGTLLHGVTVAHVFHLGVKGPGSYAKHMALGALYDGLSDKADTLAEAYQGAYGLIDGWPSSFDLPDGDPLEWVRGLSRFVQENRKAMGDDSEIQNLVDDLQGLIDSTLYKMTFLE